MMKVALLSCTSKKKPYRCKASEMYSESPRFALAYMYAKMTCDAVFILSAKYGLIPETMEIEPYNETLKDKSTNERKEWSQKVMDEMNHLFSLQKDEFLVLAGGYNEYLLPHLIHYRLPLKGVSLGNWIPRLRELIDGVPTESENKTHKGIPACEEIHRIFNEMPRLRWLDIRGIPFSNGIYILFEKGEKYQGMDRIVRVGTHRADGRLKDRLNNHFVNENKDGSIFRKNIGRAILHSTMDPYEILWELNTSDPKIKIQYASLLDLDYQRKIERKVSSYIKEKFSFVCFQVDTEQERLRLEEGLIATLNQASSFKSSSSWFGLNSPITVISESGLWNVQGLGGMPLTRDEVLRIEALVKGVNESARPAAKPQEPRESIPKASPTVRPSSNRSQGLTADIRNHISQKLETAKENGLPYIDIVSGDIHKEMNLISKMPSVCGAMYQLKGDKDEVLHTTPSGKSSTIKIRYYV